MILKIYNKKILERTVEFSLERDNDDGEIILYAGDIEHREEVLKLTAIEGREDNVKVTFTEDGVLPVNISV
jgi:hypothetical protein